MRFLSSFRIRLLLILALLLIATLSLQYYLNLKSQSENDNLREKQEQAFLAGIALGVNSISSNDRLRDFVKREGQSFFDKRTTDRIKDILVINPQWQVNDSLSDRYLPSKGENGETNYFNLKDLKDLPPLMEGRSRLGADIDNFPKESIGPDQDADGETHAIPIETSEGRYYIIVVLKNDRRESAQRATLPLVYMLVTLLFSTLITFLLVWRFTRPIANLSKAAKRVAEGDLDFELDDALKTDEMGQLATQFNEMTAELRKTHELQAQLQEAEKSAVVGRLATAIAHEIRNPLNYINLTLDHLRNKFKPEDAARQETFKKLTSQLKTEVERINQQISDLLRYSRPMNLNIVPTSIRKVIDDSLRIVEPFAKEQNIKPSIVEREDVPEILGDREVLRSVFNNLLINAAQAMEKSGGKLNVVLSSSDVFVNIEVRDTGDGIPVENLEKVFEPYFSTKETGTGLGLAIVKKIVDDHQGEITVESNLGEGTCFTVKLPRAK
ncbi:MAG: HAMP domain-containing protein [Acidobacteria bacterium]|nr:HAMP domain-containing protein [Acidobacteriota bacterium]